MSAFSKRLQPTSTTLSCHELVHVWTPSCTNASAGIFRSCFLESLKIYSVLYLVGGILRKAGVKYFTDHYLQDVLRSSLFLGVNGGGFAANICLLRKLLGSFNFTTVVFLPGLISSVVAILIEKKGRRSTLALYMTNLAIETMYNMLKQRQLVKPIPNGEIILFCTATATMMYLYQGDYVMIFVMERTFLSWKRQYCFVGEIAVKRLVPDAIYRGSGGMYYAVDYVNTFYFGRVVSVEGCFADLKFLHSKSSTSSDWPRTDDVDRLHYSCIFYGPVLLEGNCPYTISSQREVEKVHCFIRKQHKQKKGGLTDGLLNSLIGFFLGSGDSKQQQDEQCTIIRSKQIRSNWLQATLKAFGTGYFIQLVSLLSGRLKYLTTKPGSFVSIYKISQWVLGLLRKKTDKLNDLIAECVGSSMCSTILLAISKCRHCQKVGIST
ncbi:Transmembrane protein 135 [Acropora cervicornis]|uniref:Transmembrane protein 135 n=1 Tax=Acropora cervicornis TaxID=6130 RepID=A0AAD9VE03_ACRCE|nr:Transmembrane protein 135 [Acropora cervicornis]